MPDAIVDDVARPITVQAEDRAAGSPMYVQVTIPPEHPAYEIIAANVHHELAISVDPHTASGELMVWDGTLQHWAFPPPAEPADGTVRLDSSRVGAVVDSLADNPRYVRSGLSKGLSRAEIDRSRPVPHPSPVGIGDAVAALFGARLTGKADKPVEEITRVVPNRADRRRARRRG